MQVVVRVDEVVKDHIHQEPSNQSDLFVGRKPSRRPQADPVHAAKKGMCVLYDVESVSGDTDFASVHHNIDLDDLGNRNFRADDGSWSSCSSKLFF